jgi:hypothetical protein
VRGGPRHILLLELSGYSKFLLLLLNPTYICKLSGKVQDDLLPVSMQLLFCLSLLIAS